MGNLISVLLIGFFIGFVIGRISKKDTSKRDYVQGYLSALSRFR